MMNFPFSVLAFYFSTSLSICIIFSSAKILDFTKIPCCLSSPRNCSSREYGHVKLICFKCSFNNLSVSCLQNLISLNLEEDNIFTSSLDSLTVSIFHILVQRGKGGQAHLFPLSSEVDTPLICIWYVISCNNNLSSMKCSSQCGSLVLPIILT